MGTFLMGQPESDSDTDNTQDADAGSGGGARYEEDHVEALLGIVGEGVGGSEQVDEHGVAECRDPQQRLGGATLVFSEGEGDRV